MRTAIAVLLVLLILPGSPASAEFRALALEEFRASLTGGDTKEWVLVRVEKFMGAGQQCRQGETYYFNADGTVDHGRCIDGTWVEETLAWSLRDIDDLDRELTIGDVPYIALLRVADGEEQMRLRIRAGDKSTPSVDRVLRHELD